MKSNQDTLNMFLLKSGRLDKISAIWSYKHKDLISNNSRAFEVFFPDEAQQAYDEAAEDLQHLNLTCGRGK